MIEQLLTCIVMVKVSFEETRNGLPLYHRHGSEALQERDRLVSAFEEESDGENESLEDWNDDRNIEQSGNMPFSGLMAPSENGTYQQVNTEFFDNVNRRLNDNIAEYRRDQPTSSSSSRFPFNHSIFSTLGGFVGLRRSDYNASSVSNNDGVFANLTAKPDGDKKPSEDVPPSYEEAAADATPPYWETTITASGLSDDLFIEGLPVGSPINFVWNMMVSSAFQFVGFFLTYLLHTTHAAKQGSRAGLGFTLLQCGYYLQPDSTGMAPVDPPNEFEPSNPNDYDVSPYGSITGQPTVGHASGSQLADVSYESSGGNWISTALMVIGVIIILKSVFDYFQIRRMEFAILNSHGNADNQENVESSSPPLPPPPPPAGAARAEEMV